MRRTPLLLLLLLALAACCAAGGPRRSVLDDSNGKASGEHAGHAGHAASAGDAAIAAAAGGAVGEMAAEKAEEAVLQEAVRKQSLYDEATAREERNRAATGALFVGALVGGSAVYCVMRGVPKPNAAGGGGGGAGAPAGNDDLKQRLNRLKAAQAAAV